MIDKYTYRIFLTKTKEMCFVRSIHFGTRKVIVSSKFGNHSVPLKGNILMEDTGIRDINNKRIYEGDILRLRINDNKLTKNYVEAIASQWKLSKINTVKEAMVQAEKEYRKMNQAKEKKKQELKQESLPT